MKICRISKTFPTTKHNGIGLHAYFISNIIKEPTLILTRYTEDDYLEYPEHVKVQAIKYLHYPFPQSKSQIFRYSLAALCYILGQIEFFFKSLTHIIQFKPDVVHLQAPHAIFLGLFAKYFLDAKVVLTFHGSDLLRVKDNTFFFYFLRKVDKIFYVSSNMLEVLSEYFPPDKLAHTPSGLDLEFYSSGSVDGRENLIIAVGNLRWQKGYDILIEAFSEVIKKEPSYKLIIIGSGPDKEKLEALSKELNIEEKIEFLDQQPREIVRDYMHRSRLFVLSSVSEGMPKVILESLAAGIPIVSTRVGAVAEILEESGVVVEPSNSQALADGMLRLLQDQSLANEFVKKGQIKVKDYSWENAADNLINEIKKVVNS